MIIPDYSAIVLLLSPQVITIGKYSSLLEFSTGAWPAWLWLIAGAFGLTFIAAREKRYQGLNNRELL
jgi:hypothetical protein